jgi:hypothetical protein
VSEDEWFDQGGDEEEHDALRRQRSKGHQMRKR